MVKGSIRLLVVVALSFAVVPSQAFAQYAATLQAGTRMENAARANLSNASEAAHLPVDLTRIAFGGGGGMLVANACISKAPSAEQLAEGVNVGLAFVSGVGGEHPIKRGVYIVRARAALKQEVQTTAATLDLVSIAGGAVVATLQGTVMRMPKAIAVAGGAPSVEIEVFPPNLCLDYHFTVIIGTVPIDIKIKACLH